MTKATKAPQLDVQTQKALDRFTHKMALRLAANSYKSGWRTCSDEYLNHRFSGEARELTAALLDDDGSVNSRAKIAGEAADVANFAMFIAEKYRRALKT